MSTQRLYEYIFHTNAGATIDELRNLYYYTVYSVLTLTVYSVLSFLRGRQGQGGTKSAGNQKVRYEPLLVYSRCNESSMHLPGCIHDRHHRDGKYPCAFRVLCPTVVEKSAVFHDYC